LIATRLYDVNQKIPRIAAISCVDKATAGLRADRHACGSSIACTHPRLRVGVQQVRGDEHRAAFTAAASG
jgi:hypothetical protein